MLAEVIFYFAALVCSLLFFVFLNTHTSSSSDDSSIDIGDNENTTLNTSNSHQLSIPSTPRKTEKQQQQAITSPRRLIQRQHDRSDSLQDLSVKSSELIFDEIMNTVPIIASPQDDEKLSFDKIVSEKTPLEKKRDHILEEILQTEESYVKGLRELEEAYLKPIREKKLLSKEVFDMIFNDIAIIAGVNENFLSELKKLYFGDKLQSFNVAKLLLHYAHTFKLYTRFIGNYEVAVTTLEEEKKKNNKFKKFLEEIAHKLGEESTAARDFTIDGHMILPLQRIPRYEMLLQQLKDVTPDSDESYSLIENALLLIKEIASGLNTSQLEYSNIHKSLELSETFKLKDFFIPTRRLLFYFEGENGIQYKRSNGKRGIMDMYVFSDLLLLNRRNSKFLSKQEFIFSPHSKDDNSTTLYLDMEESIINKTITLTCTFKSDKVEPRVLEMYFDTKPEQYDSVKEAILVMLDLERQSRRSSVASSSF
ncbi:hypothetical protein FDP41_005753 [Naegleria fowleri]|uniref:DH domain-containing protein n=1 Tax=Naegleria fowleri TaxID=5763 RepID=A0A6A5BLW1_NAEFO|nr:uncharacterized protein FDP41_005753 [Naegleria fowleri]KAF0975000.1 hypothetical protein FDP41_005753 [Naegleria fowleri]CAG4710291.1 unnamed protein product [Naegleria fowleri]